MKYVTAAAILLTLCLPGWAQRNEVTVQGSGVFTKETNTPTISHRASQTGGVVAGYRRIIHKFLGAEGEFDYFRNSQRYLTPGVVVPRIPTIVRVPVDVYTAIGVAVFRVPTIYRLRPYALVGGGGIFFTPTVTPQLTTQGRGMVVYGAGIDGNITKHVALRVQYRGFVYKIPDFQRLVFSVGDYTHVAVPSAGFVVKF
jgi:opacity protein-like surface antigen